MGETLHTESAGLQGENHHEQAHHRLLEPGRRGAFLTSQAASAQSATGTVSASATVLAYLDVTKVDDVAFGQINPGSGATLTPGGSVGTGQSLGVLKIDHNSDVIVAASVPSALSLSGAPGPARQLLLRLLHLRLRCPRFRGQLL